MNKKLLLPLGSILALGLTAWLVNPFEDTGANAISSEKQKGVCWVGGREIVTPKEIEPLVKNKVNWISQTPFGWQPNPTQPEISVNTNFERTWWGESDQGIIETTQLANQHKIKTLLKPHLWVRGSWPGEIKMQSQADWEKWFSNYRSFIIHYAKLAQAQNIEILCIGTELSQTVLLEEKWRSLIREIRKVYTGKLTYAANFHEEYENVKFWDELDFIGIQAYFSLSKINNPTLEELTTRWPEHLESIEAIHKKFQKPVIFTEIGYRSTEDAAVEPWKWPQENKNASASEKTQAACYKAFFEAAWKKEWLAGAYFWKWYPHGEHSLRAIDFTPQGKEAEKVMLEYFNR